MILHLFYSDTLLKKTWKKSCTFTFFFFRPHINIHGTKGEREELHSKIVTLLDVDVEVNKDQKATLICKPCTDKMNTFWTFRERCRKIERERPGGGRIDQTANMAFQQVAPGTQGTG